MNDLKLLHDTWDPPAAPSDTARSRARTALLARTGHAQDPARRRYRLARVGARRMAVGALALAIATGVTVAQNVAGTDSRGRPRSIVPGLPTGPVANASEALERAAVAAETRTFTAPRDDQWIYTADRVGPRPHDVTRTWHRVDGRKLAYIDNGKLRIVTLPLRRGRLVPSPWDYQRLTTLPTDPDALLRWAYEQTERIDGADAAGKAYSLFNGILRRGGVLPPRLEAAIFRAMKQLPGVRLISNGTPVHGQPTLALGRVQDGWLYEEVLLDRQTYAYRGERSVVLTDDNPKEPSLKKGTVTLGIRIAAGIVDRPGQRP